MFRSGRESTFQRIKNLCFCDLTNRGLAPLIRLCFVLLGSWAPLDKILDKLFTPTRGNAVDTSVQTEVTTGLSWAMLMQKQRSPPSVKVYEWSIIRIVFVFVLPEHWIGYLKWLKIHRNKLRRKAAYPEWKVPIQSTLHLKRCIQHGSLAPDKTASIVTWYHTSTFYTLLSTKRKFSQLKNTYCCLHNELADHIGI